MPIRQAVRIVLTRSTDCRNDDRRLIDGVLLLCPAAHPSTIVRYRAMFQNQQNQFLPDDLSVAKRRNRHKR